jgi:galactose mutarotase-like enzyme
MLTTLENEHIQILIHSKGAELTSLKLKLDNVQYLWQADKKVWNRHAPILFPIVGKLKDNSYTYNGNAFSLSQHGFARDCSFELVTANSECAVYQLSSNDETKKLYPFGFLLTVLYRIEGNTIHISYTVKNTSSEEMHFSIGAHPGFNCPLLPNESIEDYYLEFAATENISTYPLVNGLIANGIKKQLGAMKKIPLSQHLFQDDALILEDLHSNTISIKNNVNNKSITLDFSDFPYLGIWSKPEGAPFICLEPWYGIADQEESTGDFINKKGIRHLEENEVFQCTYKITIE